jgi:lysine N6-hydroxylase
MIYDIIGIGIGPFNLGLAALASDIPDLNCIFFDQREGFDWHSGLLLPTARMQVPYYADLVTLVQPTSRFSYFSFLHAKKRMFRFAIQDNPFPLRREYNEYCQWVCGQLPSLHFGYTCINVSYVEDTRVYTVQVEDANKAVTTFHGKHIVIGIGMVPYVPACAKGLEHPAVFHASEYLFKKENLANKNRITIIGSGQSAAEIFQDLLSSGHATRQLAWFTRSPRFFPMESSKLSWEMTSPDYIDYFCKLPAATKRTIVAQQAALYKGINQALISDIYDQLYVNSLDGGDQRIKLFSNCVLQKMVSEEGVLHLEFKHTEEGQSFCHSTDAVILATGYCHTIPAFVKSIVDCIEWTPNGQYLIKRNYSIDRHIQLFVQNADLLTHGFNSADLGMGPYRNAVILNNILGYEHFVLEKNIAFQTFGVLKT